jgi:amicyanin
MRKAIAIDARAGVFSALVAAAMVQVTTAEAGPGCMGGQPYMTGGYYPHTPMAPGARFAPRAPHGPQMAQPRHMGMPMMAAPNQPPMYPQRVYPGYMPAPGATPAVEDSQSRSASSVASGGEEATGENVTVRIDGMRFDPPSITVKPGTTVTWVHGSSMPHTISGNGGVLRSSTLYGGQSYSHTFGEAGRYDYICEFHPSMKGSVLVESGGKDT